MKRVVFVVVHIFHTRIFTKTREFIWDTFYKNTIYLWLQEEKYEKTKQTFNEKCRGLYS